MRLRIWGHVSGKRTTMTPTTTTTETKPMASGSGPQPSQKSMTKAERRELQEKQRAAKAALKQNQGATLNPPQTPKPKQQSASQKKQSGTDPQKSSHAPSTSSKDASMHGTVDTTPRSRSLRIFSHFSPPKPVGLGVKGDIHPVILSLGLQFANFTICGANARCIATLTAFKTVRTLSILRSPLNM